MRREERFILSHRPYAVDLSSLRVDGTYARVDAVWFRRRQRVTVACIGYLWDYQRPVPHIAMEFLDRHDDGRYGGKCEGRWDGERYWGAQDPDVIERHLAILRPMLANFPTIPDGYDGWWTFMQKGTR